MERRPALVDRAGRDRAHRAGQALSGGRHRMGASQVANAVCGGLTKVSAKQVGANHQPRTCRDDGYRRASPLSV
jgi:hypothetical protein